MQYPEQYRTELLKALKRIDLHTVDETLEILREARALGRCIFVCGSGSSAIAASHLLSDMLKSSGANRSMSFHIFVLTDELHPVSSSPDDLFNDRVFVDQLRNVVRTGDVVVGISASGNQPSMLRAFEYASEIGCRTICISGRSDKLAIGSDAAILVPASPLGSVEDAHIILCRMIGNYFVNFDND